MNKILDKLVCYLCKYDKVNINTDEAEIIKYGLEIIILKIIFWISSLFIGILMGLFIESAIYLISFSILRSYAGGYHAKSRTKCFIQSMLTIIISMNLLKFAKVNHMFSSILLLMSLLFFIIIWLYAPIDTENKMLEVDEYKKFRKKTRIILLSDIILILLTHVFKLDILSYPIILTIITSGILVMSGYINKNS